MNISVFHQIDSRSLWSRASLILFSTLCLGLTTCNVREESVAGAAGIGDPYYASLGNGGYDVTQYLINLKVEPLVNEVDGIVTISATANQSLSSFNLDLEGMYVDSVDVDGTTAQFSRHGHELTITPAKPLSQNSDFEVRIAYHGTPGPTKSLASDYADDLVGWFQVGDEVFLNRLRTYAERFQHGNAGAHDYIQLADSVAFLKHNRDIMFRDPYGFTWHL